MNNCITWQQWAQQVSAYIERQKQRIDTLEQTVTKLQTDLNALKNQKGVHIDRIEYKFDQLKVEKLDGTLTIGISPSLLDKIDDLTVNGASVGKNAGTDTNSFFQGQGQGQGQSQGQGGISTFEGIGLRQDQEKAQRQGTGHQGQDQGQGTASGFDIQQEVSTGIAQYLQYGVHADMNNLENKYQFPLDEDYKALIIDDIRKQLDTRIQLYINQYRGVGFKEPIEAVTTSIIEKTKQDIFRAIESYISSLPRKEG
ncbi:spore germination protein GerPC [Paenibacillus alginolyticus]|uniref:Spore germination protein GerPC n=1 Tax=Paenibacillus alginolyticus TaxID=59839 RepID=A0ABT4G7F3_9BACL|nr:spore germination protein GerPC [Paenibacillus alginolyticus]MCY9665325.1 spore germination protein GerPC [Paenibacillus alginolyticus]MCY9692113.1 spore germination protein GerPC [Paenibacillus alginolyticus]MEC0147879.1 spore germination protein GerPC [Paenibacillus alginolyticus]